MITRRLMGSLAALVLSGLLACSTTAAAADKVALRMHWLVNGTALAWYLGKQRGYFEQAGIDLTINEGRGSVVTTQVVGSGTEPFGTADAVSVIQAISKGVPIKAVMTLQDMGPLGIIVLADSGITTVKELKGKRLAVTAGDAQTQQWPVVAKANSLGTEDVKLAFIDGPSKTVALMNKRVDAILGSCIDHVVLVRNSGGDPRCMTFAENGVATVGVAVIAHDQIIKSNPGLVQRFVDAATRSFQAFYQDPQAALDAAAAAVPDIDRKVLIEQAKIIKTYYGDRVVGPIIAKDWQATVETMKQADVLTGDLPASTYYRAEFVNK
ncbi:ABC transporter substrate-binding protein [Bosea sp. (in: a-proteobacteria)]|uniref:ABC transporter substrate-binding protein n=1 Tax=Bosea sp. (in: a-proteobacteria) TaxID=1871050 RepID=UPI003B3A18AE